MGPVELAPGVHWVGAMDPQLRVFDVIMKAEHGTTYNAYLVKGSRSSALIETVKSKFTEQYLQTLSGLVDLSEVEYIVVNHTEPDHSGSLGALLEVAINAHLVSARNAVPFIRGILNRDVDVHVVKDGDRLDLGGMTLEFMEAPFLHWPDTMFTFLHEQGILFPCDFLGSHFADERMFDNEVDDFSHAFRYYFNVIFRPFKEFVRRGLDKIEGLPIQMIAPSHGPILRTDLHTYIGAYREWSREPEADGPPRVMVFYASSYGNTGRMAASVAEGVRDAGADVAVFDLEATEPGEILDHLEQAAAIAVGSLTINGDAVKPVWDFLSSLATLRLRGKSAVAFGSYGWSGEAVKLMEERLRGIKFKVPVEGVRAQLVPTAEDLSACRELGRSLVGSIKR